MAVGSGLDLLLRPGTADSAICECATSNCSCGSTCCSGFSEFCCTVNDGYNYCPENTVMGGWWKADNSAFCSGPRYYMDCNAVCGCDSGCGGSWHFCDPACDGVTCGCGSGSCDHWAESCFQFRYGQCNQNVDCMGRIVCRVAACVPPWEVDPTCTTVVAVDEGTATHNAPCWTSNPPSPPPGQGETMPRSQVVNFRTQRIDVFQVYGGVLWHKWNNGTGWNNENVGAAVGARPRRPASSASRRSSPRPAASAR